MNCVIVALLINVGEVKELGKGVKKQYSLEWQECCYCYKHV